MARLDRSGVALIVNVRANKSQTLQKKSALNTSFNFGAWPWTTLLSGCAALNVAAVYMVGSMFHRLYEMEFHVLGGSYPQDRSETLLNGILVLNEAVHIFCSWLRSNLSLLLLILSCFVVVGVLWAWHRTLSKSSKSEEVVQAYRT